MRGIGGPNVVDDGLVLYLDAANEKSYPGSGTSWSDVSGNNLNGTLVNGPTYATDNYGTIVFDGTNDYVNLGNVLSVANGTIDFWINLDNNIVTTSNVRPWGKNGFYESRWGGTGADSPENLKYRVDLDRVGGLATVVSNKTTWSAGVWYNITVTWNSSGGTCILYVNGEQDATQSGTVSSQVGSTGNFTIGASAGSAGFVDGKIPLFRGYNRNLSSAEVAQNYNATKTRFGL